MQINGTRNRGSLEGKKYTVAELYENNTTWCRYKRAIKIVYDVAHYIMYLLFGTKVKEIILELWIVAWWSLHSFALLEFIGKTL